MLSPRFGSGLKAHEFRIKDRGGANIAKWSLVKCIFKRELLVFAHENYGQTSGASGASTGSAVADHVTWFHAVYLLGSLG